MERRLNPERYKQLFKITDRMQDAMRSARDPDATRMRELFESYCRIITKIAKDEDLYHVLGHFSEESVDRDINEQIRHIFNDFEVFVEFLDVEKEALVYAGTSHQTADAFRFHVALLRRELARAEHYDLNPGYTMENLQRLSNEVCEIASSTASYAKQSRRWHTIAKYATHALGWTGIAANASVAIPAIALGSITISTAAITIASTVAGKLIDKWASDF